ncbi:MAG: FAD-binding protein [Janthinobacterium lividum]
MRSKQRFLLALLAGFLLALALGIRPAVHLWQAHRRDVPAPRPLPPGLADDGSHLNATPVAQQLSVAADTAAALVQLRHLLALARVRHLPVALVGAQHSQGGHTLARGGIRLNMLPFNCMRLDTVSQVLTVGSGGRWAEVIPYLNRYGRAVGTMQSDNVFSVGGSLSVNCHGWQPNQPPIAATVVSLRLLLADGRLLTCSRTQNQELFSLALGGYGLLGIILDARLRTVPNAVYAYRRVASPATDYVATYAHHVDKNPRARLAYGRLNVTAENFLNEAQLNYFDEVRAAGPGYSMAAPGLYEVKRAVFVGSKRDAYGKRLRWQAEQAFSRSQVGAEYSRNQIMNESPALYLNRSAGQTDVLHEYFIPRRRFNQFRRALQQLVPAHQADLLNVTLRNVYADHDTFLPYAREEMFGFVLFFNQATTPAAEADMATLTQTLIEAARQCGGTYYLPYRPHATPAQLRQVYPQWPAFVARKRAYDPDGVFQNEFWRRYGPAF